MSGVRRIGRILTLCATLLLPAPTYAGQAKSAEEIWKALENVPTAEREKKLVEGAKIEGGGMVYYTNTGVDNANRYLQAFKKAYPFIDAQVWRRKSREVAQKFVTESRAGVFVADVVKTTTEGS